MDERYRAWRESGRAGQADAESFDAKPQVVALPDAEAAHPRRQELAVSAEAYRRMLADRLALAMAAPEPVDSALTRERGGEDEDFPDPAADDASEPAESDGARACAEDPGSGPAPDRSARGRFLLGRASGALTTLMLLALAATPLVLPQGPAARAAALDTRDETASRLAPRAARTSDPLSAATPSEPLLTPLSAVIRHSGIAGGLMVSDPGRDIGRVAALGDHVPPSATTHGIARPLPRLIREPAPAVRPDRLRSRPAPLRQAQVAAPVEDGYVKDEGRPLLFDPRAPDGAGLEERPSADKEPPFIELAPSLRRAPEVAQPEPMIPRPSRGLSGNNWRADAAMNAAPARKRMPGSSNRTRKAGRSMWSRTSASAGSIDLASALCTLFQGWPVACEVRRPAAGHRAAARRGGRGYVSVNDIIMTALNRP